MLPVLEKMLNKLCSRRPAHWIVEEKRLSKNQYGFRSEKITTDAIKKMVKMIREEKQRGLQNILARTIRDFLKNRVVTSRVIESSLVPEL